MNNEIALTEYFAAGALRAAGVRFLRAEPGHRVRLIFDNSDGVARRLLDQHLNGGFEVNSADFAAAVQATKTEIFAIRNGG